MKTKVRLPTCTVQRRNQHVPNGVLLNGVLARGSGSGARAAHRHHKRWKPHYINSTPFPQTKCRNDGVFLISLILVFNSGSSSTRAGGGAGGGGQRKNCVATNISCRPIEKQKLHYSCAIPALHTTSCIIPALFLRCTQFPALFLRARNKKLHAHKTCQTQKLRTQVS